MIQEVIRNKKFQWIDIIDPSEEDATKIAETFKLHPLALEDALDPQHLPKIEKFENIIFIVLRHFDENCDYIGDNVRQLTRKISIFIGKGFLITMHRKENSITRRLKAMFDAETSNSPEIIQELIESVLKSYEDPIEHEQDIIEKTEEKIFRGRANKTIMEDLYEMKQKAYIYRRMLLAHKDLLIHKEVKTIITNEADQQDISELAAHMYYNAEELQEAIGHLLTIHLSIASHQTGEVMRLLTIFSIFFLPLTFLAGVYGMNFHYMPELKWKYGYPLSIGLMVLVVIALYLWFRRWGWLK